MRLVLISDTNKIVHVYEDQCTKTQIDEIFENYLKLYKESKKPKAIQPTISPQATYLPTLTGAKLTQFMQGQITLFFEEAEYRKKLQKKADYYLLTQAKIKSNLFFGIILKFLKKAWTQFSKTTEVYKRILSANERNLGHFVA